MKSLGDAGEVEVVLGRLARLSEEGARRWGRMTPHGMVCHLADAYRSALGLRAVSAASGGGRLRRGAIKFVALRVPLPWPRGVKTRPEVDQEAGGTRPAEFARDVDELKTLIERFAREAGALEGRTHPIFGAMSKADWLRWGYLHADHHLRQFNL